MGTFKVLFILKVGSVRTERIDGRDALVLEPGTTLEYRHPLLSPSKEHTISGLVHRLGRWQSYEAEPALSSGVISLQSRAEPLIITNLRKYNWQTSTCRTGHDIITDIRPLTGC